ncbi:Golgi-associated plant pathogenesis-related protein 1-like [Huso huso]|uniref:Golgi-associated plant pathogenesis-related protein 1-like n=1 Tax=Huso huso TaxID=61971 RepID=A0ABR1A0E3_HUSHU
MGKSASKQFAEEVLRAHNECRKKHRVPGLKLSSKLNREAQQYAEALASTRVLKHSAESSRGQCGENLAWASYDEPGKEVAERWYNEIKITILTAPDFPLVQDTLQPWCGKAPRRWASGRQRPLTDPRLWWQGTSQPGTLSTRDSLMRTCCHQRNNQHEKWRF